MKSPLEPRSKKVPAPKIPWLFRLPKPFQINSSLLFIALFCMLIGAGALFGLSDPSPITSKMSLPFYNTWGAGLILGGGALGFGIITREQLVEKFSARILGIMLSTFGFWSIAAVGVVRAAVTLSLITMVIFFLEQRICFINVILNAKQALAERGDFLTNDGE